MYKIFHYFFTFFVFAFFSLVFLSKVQSANTYTMSQVAEHNTPSSCWMVIEGNVYDVTSYLPKHDNRLDIRSWCGQDATVDYNTKAGRNKGHSFIADNLLKKYIVGILVADVPETTTDSTKASQSPKSATQAGTTAVTITTTPVLQRPTAKTNQYNVWLPLLVTIILYLVSSKLMPKPSHNFVWDSVLLLGLIPSFIFGMILALDLDGPNLIYYHVEWSIVFGVSCILHLIFRLKVYISQGKFMFRKKKEF